jgi:hypothetical protein
MLLFFDALSQFGLAILTLIGFASSRLLFFHFYFFKLIFSALFRCGDRLLAVDGHTLENIPHALAVSMLKQTSTRVVLEVVSWMGTEL